MEVLTPSSTPATLEGLDGDKEHGDYVYMYPPRQAYRNFDPATSAGLPDLIATSLANSDLLNLYLHVPFCKQICAFCNLYTTRLGNDTDLRGYVELLIAEARLYARMCERKTVQTFYLGGGTPSLLDPRDVEALLTRVLRLFMADGTPPPAEVAIEVAPETVDAAKLRDLRGAGINRINLGLQSMVAQEVARLGRRRPESRSHALIEEALGVGFANVCVDLIYGLRHQTDSGWETSLRDVIELSPHTVCAYALTSRPHTGYRRQGFGGAEAEVLYRRYEMAHQMLTDAGYSQDTHVRWTKKGGGYLQKEYHWGMQNLLGIGAGARSYLWSVDTRNGYSIRSRKDALSDYTRSISQGHLGIVDGFHMSAEERARKAIVLGVMDLDRAWFEELTGSDPVALYPEEFGILERLDLCTIVDDRIRLTERGRKYRDIIVQMFFSDAVRRRLSGFRYLE
ncbi:coproporphyrinogen-III oxidase family protein [Actinomadura coerulea]|uniref:coproporphyrinogen-III oxidase family protein n=1 Tax=Actinomadura coerulea TaxID=46159 RepID=UPI0034305D5E